MNRIHWSGQLAPSWLTTWYPTWSYTGMTALSHSKTYQKALTADIPIRGNILRCNDPTCAWPNPGQRHSRRRFFNPCWMTNQPDVTGQELTGNRCIQPPVPHQYGVWLFSIQASSSIFPSLCVSPSMSQLLPTSVSAVCFFGSHGIFSILRTSLFHLPCIPVIGLPGRGTQFGCCRALAERDKSWPSVSGSSKPDRYKGMTAGGMPC